jgi:hypothetical protein
MTTWIMESRIMESRIMENWIMTGFWILTFPGNMIRESVDYFLHSFREGIVGLSPSESVPSFIRPVEGWNDGVGCSSNGESIDSFSPSIARRIRGGKFLHAGPLKEFYTYYMLLSPSPLSSLVRSFYPSCKRCKIFQVLDSVILPPTDPM